MNVILLELLGRFLYVKDYYNFTGAGAGTGSTVLRPAQVVYIS